MKVCARNVVFSAIVQLGSVASSQDVTMIASGTFEVTLTPQPMVGDGEGVEKLGRMSIDKTFEGDLEGTSKGEMLSAYGNVDGSAGYVAMERVEGTLDGRRGSFILQHSATMAGGEQQQSITVVPDSGTDELTGIEGRMTIRIENGQHFYELELKLPE